MRRIGNGHSTVFFSLLLLGLGAGCGGSGGKATPPTAPNFTTQPQDATVVDGQTATFTVGVSGTSPALQWRKNGADVPGATSASYTTAALTLADSGAHYSVVASNAKGSAISNDALLTVNPASPSITQEPAGLTVSEGLPATFTVVAAGSAPLHYQWKRAGTDIPNATAASYSLSAVTIADDGATFSVAVSNAAGTVTSNAAMLSVVPGLPQSSSPIDTTVNEGQTASFSVTATGSGLSYQWQKNGQSIAGATSATYTIAATTAADDGALFSVIVSNAGGSVTAGPARLTVRKAPRITVSPSSLTVVERQTATFSVVATGFAPLSYQWRRDTVNISGATAASFTTAVTTIADSGAHFDVVVTNQVSSITSAQATLTVTSAPPTVTLAGISVNEGLAATFTPIVTSSTPVTYQWRKNGTNISGATEATFTTAVTVAADDGTIYSVVVTNSGGATTSGNARLTVNAAPRIAVNPANATVVEGQAAIFSVTAIGFAPLAYQWRRDGTDISGANAASFNTGATAFADSGAVFTVLVSNSVGNVTSGPATLTVTPQKPIITAQPAAAEVVESQTATFTVAATSSVPITYQWRKAGQAIANANTASFTTAATTFADNNTAYSVVVSNSAGSTTSNSAVLTVDFAPRITTQPQAVTVHQSQTATFTVSAIGTAPLSYQWSENGAAIPGATSASYTTPPTAPEDDGAVFSVTVTNGQGSVPSANATLHVIINRPPNPSAPAIVIAGAPSGTSQVSANDPDSGQSFTYSVTGSPQNGTAVVSTTGLVTYTPTPGFFGTDSVTVTVTDNGIPNLSGSVTISVTVQHTLVLTVIANPQPVASGSPVTYRLVVSNQGIATVSGVTVSDVTQSNFASLAVVGGVGGCSFSSKTCSWSALSIAPGRSQTLGMALMASGATGAMIHSDITVTAGTGSFTQGIDVPIAPTPLTVSLAEDKSPVAPNGTLTYQVVVANSAAQALPADAGGSLSVAIPSGAAFVSASNGGVLSSGKVVWNFGFVEAGSARRFSFTLSVGALADGTLLPAVAQVIDAAAVVAQSETATEVRATVPIALTVSANSDPAVSGDFVTYQYRVSNLGATTLTNVVLTDVTLSNFGEATSPGVGNCGGVFSGLDQRFCNFTISSIGAGQSVTLMVTRTVSGSAGTLIHTDLSVPFAGGVVTRRVDVVIAPGASLSLRIAGDHDPVLAGDTLTYQVVAGNVASQALPASGAGILTATVPPGTSFVSATHGGVFSNGVVQWNPGSVEPSGNLRYSYTVAVGSGVAPGTVLPAVAQLLDSSDIIVRAETSAAVAVSSPLRLSVSVNADPAVSGDILTYEYRVSNLGATTLTNVVLTDVTLGNFGSAVSPGIGNCGGVFSGLDQRICNFTISSIGAGQTQTLLVTRTVSGHAGALIHTDLSIPLSVTRGVDVVIAPSAGLSLRIDEDHDPVLPGDSLTYQVVAGNVASQALPASGNGILTATVPAGTTFVSATNGGTFSNGVVQWNPGSVEPSGNLRYSYTVSVGSGVAPATVLLASAQLLDANDILVRAETSSEVKASLPLRLTVSVNADPAVSGEIVTYEYRISNLGNTSLSNVVMTDLTLSNFGASVVPGVGSCGGVFSHLDQRLCAFTTASIGAGQTVTWVVTRTASGHAGALVHSDLFVSFAGGLLTRGVDVVIAPAAGLSLRLDEDHDPVLPGDSLTYQIVAGNVANQALPASGDGVLTATVPAGTTFVSATNGGVFANGIVQWNPGSIAPRGTQRYSYTVSVGSGVPPAAVLPAMAQLLDASDILVRAETSTDVKASLPLKLTVSVNADPAVSGDIVTYEYRISNTGNTSLSNVVLTDLTLTNFGSSVFPGVGNCGGVFSGLDQRFCALTLASIGPGQTAILLATRTVNGNAGALLHSDLSVSYSGGLLTRGVEVVIVPSAGLTLHIDGDHDAALAGDTLTYSIVIANPTGATLPAAGGGTVTATVPPGTTFVSASSGGTQSGGVVQWSVGPVAAGTAQGFSFAVALDPAAPAGEVVLSTAELSGSGASLARASAATDVQAAIPLGVTFAAAPNPVASNGVVGYTVNLTNHGTTTLSGIVLSEMTMTDFSHVAITAGAASCPGIFSGLDGRLCVWQPLTLTAGQTQTLSFSLTASGVDGALLHSDLFVSYPGGAATRREETVIHH